MKIKAKGRTLRIYLDKQVYSEEVLYKCFYWYGTDFNVEILSHSKKSFLVILESKGTINDFEDLTNKIKQDLVDFKLRNIVNRETKVIRELLIAKAFAYYDIEGEPSTDVSDPIGFNPDELE